MKKVFFFMALAVAGLAMTACGGSKEDGKKDGNSVATDAKAYAKAIDNVMKADDPQKTIAAAEALQKMEEELEKKYQDNKEFEETLAKELKNLGYDETIEDELVNRVRSAQQAVEGGSMDMGNMNMGDMGDMDMSDMNMDDMDMSGMDMGDIDMSDMEEIAY